MRLPCLLNDGVVGDNCVFGDNVNAVNNVIIAVVAVGRNFSHTDGYVMPDSCIFVDNRFFNMAIFPDTDTRNIGFFISCLAALGFVVVRSHTDNSFQYAAGFDNGSNTDYGSGNCCIGNNTTFTTGNTIQLRSINF